MRRCRKRQILFRAALRLSVIGLSTRSRAGGLANPAKKEGVYFDDDAIEEILRVTECYPYFIQEWGFHVWNHAPSTTILRQDVLDATLE